MEKMIAACGLDCAKVNAFIAWKTDDNALRAKTAGEWAKAYNFAFTPEMINCSGCLEAADIKIGHCAVCVMRTCAQRKPAETCASCACFPCKTEEAFHAQGPADAQNLKRL